MRWRAAGLALAERLPATAIACAVFTGILVLALGVSLAPALRAQPAGANHQPA